MYTENLTYVENLSFVFILQIVLISVYFPLLNYLPLCDKWWPYLGDIIYPDSVFLSPGAVFIRACPSFCIKWIHHEISICRIFSSVTTLCPIKSYMPSNYYWYQDLLTRDDKRVNLNLDHNTTRWRCLG